MRFVVFKANVQTLFIKYKYKQNKVTKKHTRKKKAERAEHTACYNDIGTKKFLRKSFRIRRNHSLKTAATYSPTDVQYHRRERA